MNPIRYQRLPGRGRPGGFALSASRCSLWTADDHLLSLETTIGAESYRRFYFRDIQAFIVRPTNKRAVWNIILVSLTLLCAAPFAVVAQRNPDEPGWLVTALVLAGFGLMLVGINSLLGRRCVTHIRTAVQLELLPSLHRLHIAEMVLTRLKPVIEQTQGALSSEQLASTDWNAIPSGSGAATVGQEPVDRRAASGPVRHEPGRIHAAMFGLLFLDAGFAAWGLVSDSPAVTALELSATLAGMFVLIFALRRQTGSDLPRGVKRLTWSVLGYQCGGLAVAVLYGLVYAVRHQQQQAPLDVSVLTNEPGFFAISMTFSAIAVALGTAGLLLLWKRRVSPGPPPLG